MTGAAARTSIMAMNNAIRLSEKWFVRALWLIALAFAFFLIGLGNAVVGDLPQVEADISIEQFMDKPAGDVQQQQDQARARRLEAESALDQAELKRTGAQKEYEAARATFDNWVATRQATGRADQDAELKSRTAALDALKATETAATRASEAERQKLLDAQQAEQRAEAAMIPFRDAAQARFDAAIEASELRVFLYRLALTLPLLAIAGWLFARARKGRWWPFVWGFIFFALFAFFVELVPYLPSYGGYVRYSVGIIITMIVGRWAIIELGKYLERQKLAEAQPETMRRQDLAYDQALARLAKGVCPGCERPVDLKNPDIDFCPHCGIGLFERCGNCSARKGTFSPFCHKCGAKAEPA
ncbi:zinc ribbon domain-containing protein [Sandarakinorhabdus sp. AAP62]|uniref:zinc ribbon domain-containing protein n=1 Tax=Sandarakinorhabdus sp. AAP62 TaxID=1248916 RepID=UPI0002FDCD4D|nr:zinc ribbon domain-containing protein [Sandarakinorhabdus sp. AAP62]